MMPGNERRKTLPAPFRSQLRRNMGSGVGSTAIAIGLVLIQYPVYLRFLGYQRYGLWLVLSTVMTFSQLGGLGIGPALTKLVAEEHSKKNLPAIKSYTTTAVFALSVTGVMLAVGFTIFRRPISAAFRLTGDEANLFCKLLPYVAGLSIYTLIVQALQGTLAGLGRMDLSFYAQLLGRAITLAVSTLLLMQGRGVESLVLASLASLVAMHFLVAVMIRRTVTVHTFSAKWLDWHRFKRLLMFGTGVFGGSLLSMLLAPLHKLLIARYIGLGVVSTYEIAFTGTYQIRTVVESGLRALMPEISNIAAKHSQAGTSRISTLSKQALRLIILGGVPLYVVLFALAQLALHVWLGGRFLPAQVPAFRLMLVGSFLSLLAVPAYYTLLGLGRVRECFVGHAIQSFGSFAIICAAFFLCGAFSLDIVVGSMVGGFGGTTIYLMASQRRALAKLAEKTKGFGGTPHESKAADHSISDETGAASK